LKKYLACKRWTLIPCTGGRVIFLLPVTSLPMTLATVLEAPARMVDVSTAPRRSGLRHVLGHIQERYHCLHPLLYATLIQYKLIIGPFAYLHFPSSLWGSTGGRRQKAALGAVRGGAEGWARPRRFQRTAEVPGAQAELVGGTARCSCWLGSRGPRRPPLAA